MYSTASSSKDFDKLNLYLNIIGRFSPFSANGGTLSELIILYVQLKVAKIILYILHQDIRHKCHLMKVVQAPHMRLEVWPTRIRPVIRAHSWNKSILFRPEFHFLKVCPH